MAVGAGGWVGSEPAVGPGAAGAGAIVSLQAEIANAATEYRNVRLDRFLAFTIRLLLPNSCATLYMNAEQK